jgi:hypothetical protein
MILESEYPAALRGALRQAAHLASAFASPELLARLQLDRWAIGRSEEISRFVELVLGDWRIGALSERVAADQIESYVSALEGELNERLASRERQSLTPRRVGGPASSLARPNQD